MCMPSHQQPSWASGGEAAGLPMQENNSDYSRVAQHALVLGPSEHVQPDPNLPNLLTALQSDSPQESDKPKPTCISPRASAIKEQGFCETVAARIEAPQRGSTRSVYETSGPFLQVVPQKSGELQGTPPPPPPIPQGRKRSWFLSPLRRL